MSQEFDTSQQYGQFYERGYDVRAYYGERRMVVVAYKDDKEVDRIDAPPYSYEPRFGLDVQDAEALERVTDELLARLP